MSDTDWSFFDIPATAVQNNLGAMSGRADAALATANTAIAALSGIAFDPEPTPPTSPDLDVTVPVPVEPSISDYTRFGTPRDFHEPTYTDLWDSLGVSSEDFHLTVAPFAPTTTAPNFPPEPSAFDASGLPTRPTTDAITLPDAPTITMPELDTLTAITVPDFVFPTLPTFDEEAPTFEGTEPNTNPTWSEPTYSSTVESDLVARVRAMLAGGTGLPASVQQALFDQARTHEAQTALEAEQGAYDTFAGKNFAMPPGMLAEAVRRAQEKSRLEQNTAARDQLAKAATWEIENLRNAVTQGMAYETLLRNQFNNSATRAFEIAKYRVEADLKLYEAQVSLFNSRSQAFQTLANVFKIRIDGALSVLEVFKAQVQAAVAKGQLNEQLVKVFSARVDAVKQTVEMYKARMEGAKAQADIAKTTIEAYGEDVKAYAQKLAGEKERFTAYFERVRAEAEKGKGLEYEARAYEATVRGAEAMANTKKAYVEARVGSLRESVARFVAQIEAEKGNVSGSVQAIQANASAFTADTQRYTAEIQGSNESMRTELLVQQEHTKNQLALYETSMKEYDAKLSRVLEQAKIVMAGLDAAAKTSSTLAAGAMSAIHVQASMGASGTAASNNNFTQTISRQGADVA
jgi:predicted phage tail protein